MSGAGSRFFGICVCLVALLVFSQSDAKVVEYDLTIAQQVVNITGEPVDAMTINGQIPGPELRFEEGDFARIHVHNDMDVDTSIHWHGILVPPGMDGVPYVSFPPIRPHTTFTYEFPIRQSGTYWYHSHTHFQEQRGMIGSIVITKPEEKKVADREHVVVLADWTDRDPDDVYRLLKRGSDAMAREKGSTQSIAGAIKAGKLGDYFTRQLRRLPPINVADIAYDQFLSNGKQQIRLTGEPGETVRLRVINGSSTTYFLLEYSGGPMTVISADGQDVEPVALKRFLICVAETYDVLVKIPESGAYEFRATAHDGSSHTSTWFGQGIPRFAPDIPRPDLYHAPGKFTARQFFAGVPADIPNMDNARVEAGDFDKPGPHAPWAAKMKTMMEAAQKANIVQESSSNIELPQPIQEPDESDIELRYEIPDRYPKIESGKRYKWDFKPLAGDIGTQTVAAEGSAERPWAPYAALRATRDTDLPPDKPVREFRLTLDGDMERYVWMINGKILAESDSLEIKEGEVVRFIMINRTLMHHPMHLHGHFFRVVNGQGDRSPLKHTVDVAPLSTTVIEFDANEFGDWFFHCHLLYHLASGMARVVHYDGFKMSPELAEVRPELYEDPWMFTIEANMLSNTSEGFIAYGNTRHTLSASWEIGWQEVQRTEWEFIPTYDYYINRYLSVFLGTDIWLEGTEFDVIRGVVGITYLLPFDFQSRVWIDSEGGARINLYRRFQITSRLWFNGEIQYDVHDSWEAILGLYYTIDENFSLIAQWHSDYGWGGGMQAVF